MLVANKQSAAVSTEQDERGEGQQRGTAFCPAEAQETSRRGRAGRRALRPRRRQEASERSGRQDLFGCLMGDGGKLEKRNPGQDMKGFGCQTKKFGQSSVGQVARGKSFEKQI